MFQKRFWGERWRLFTLMSATSQFPEGQQPAAGLSASQINQVTLKQIQKVSLFFLHWWVTLSSTRIQLSHIPGNVCGSQGSKLSNISMFHLNIPPENLPGLILFYFVWLEQSLKPCLRSSHFFCSVQGAQQRLFLPGLWALRGVTQCMFPVPPELFLCGCSLQYRAGLFSQPQTCLPAVAVGHTAAWCRWCEGQHKREGYGLLLVWVIK